MTDNEIIKALECCCVSECDECPYDEQTACVEMMKEGTLDLIKRLKRESSKYRYKAQAQKGELARLNKQVSEQKAEIRRLQEEITFHIGLNGLLAEQRDGRDELINGLDIKIEELELACNTAKAKAIKEFAERLKEQLKSCLAYDGGLKRMIDNLLKEMTKSQ